MRDGLESLRRHVEVKKYKATAARRLEDEDRVEAEG